MNRREKEIFIIAFLEGVNQGVDVANDRLNGAEWPEEDEYITKAISACENHFLIERLEKNNN